MSKEDLVNDSDFQNDALRQFLIDRQGLEEVKMLTKLMKKWFTINAKIRADVEPWVNLILRTEHATDLLTT